MNRAVRATLFVLVSALAGTALAQPYPSKPVRVVVPWPPGGYTLVMTDVPSHAIGASLYSKLPYDPAKDLEPIAEIIDRLHAATMKALAHPKTREIKDWAEVVRAPA